AARGDEITALALERALQRLLVESPELPRERAEEIGEVLDLDVERRRVGEGIRGLDLLRPRLPRADLPQAARGAACVLVHAGPRERDGVREERREKRARERVLI